MSDSFPVRQASLSGLVCASPIGEPSGFGEWLTGRLFILDGPGELSTFTDFAVRVTSGPEGILVVVTSGEEWRGRP